MRQFKWLSTTILCLAVLAFGVTGAQAAIQNYPHDLTGIAPGSKSQCEPCHLPHGAKGERLWAVAKADTATGWPSLVVSQLCGSCHYGTPAPGNGLSADTNVSNQSNYAYAEGNHGSVVSTLSTLASDGTTRAKAASIPYVDNLSIECSSCHNPHDDTVRPFLRVSGTGATVNTLCVLCHSRGVAAAAMGSANVGTQATTFSMHPMDVAYTAGGTGHAALKTLNAVFNTSRGVAGKGVVSGAGGIDHLGGKLLDPSGTTGNMGCGTCHQVHGDGSSSAKNLWLLVTGNTLATADTTASTLAYSALCEACHEGGATATSGTTTVLAGSTKDHPIDNQATNNARFDWTPWTVAGRTAYETTYGLWPIASQTGKTHQAACTSCHSAHYGVGGSPILRTAGDTTDWCNSCHTGASKQPYGHHSNLDNKPGPTPAASIIGCGDCHRSSDTSPAVDQTKIAISMSAHRNFASVDNTSSAPVNGRRANFCLKCHGGVAFTPVLPTGASARTLGVQSGPTGSNLSTYNPTLPVVGSGVVWPATHGTTRGSGSHRLGVIRTGKAALTVPRIGAWSSGYYSMYGTGTGTGLATVVGNGSASTGALTLGTSEIICESCHNVVRNVGNTTASEVGITANATTGWANNLLLERYEDDASGTTGGGHAVGSMFCVGCHTGGASSTAISSMTLVMNKPAGTHPVTDDNVTKAQQIGRNPGTLITPTTGYANVGTAPASLSYPAANQMDCDSCHRPHDAATNSSDSAGEGAAMILEEAAATNDMQSMCVICHAY